jgi:uncharacterized cupin superfamily protein
MNIVRTDAMEWSEAMNHGPFLQRRKHLGGKKLPCSLWELAPGKKSFPFHVHHVTEEALFVLSGTAKVRSPEGLTPIRPGDFISFPPAATAHQLINDGTEPLVYLAMSAVSGADVVEYPDSGKVATSVGEGPSMKRFLFKADAQVDYFDGEPET